MWVAWHSRATRSAAQSPQTQAFIPSGQSEPGRGWAGEIHPTSDLEPNVAMQCPEAFTGVRLSWAYSQLV